MFADVTYNPQPDRRCRDMAIDPCLIERHAWDSDAFTSFICGSNRLAAPQRTLLRSLLSSLRDAS